MIVSMTKRKEKIAITLSPHLVAAAKRAVRRGRAASVSAYVAEAIAEKESRQDANEALLEIIDESLEASGGPMTDAERRWADEMLGFDPEP